MSWSWWLVIVCYLLLPNFSIIYHSLLPVIGEPPVSFGSAQVKMADSWRMLTISGGAGASGTSAGSRGEKKEGRIREEDEKSKYTQQTPVSHKSLHFLFTQFLKILNFVLMKES